MNDGGLRTLVAQFVDAGQLGFTDPAAAWAWRIVHGTAHPTMLQLETESRRLAATDPASVGVQAILGADDWRDLQWARTQIVEWARRQTFRAGFDQAASAWNAGRSDEAYDVMRKHMDAVAAIALDDADRGWFFEDFEDRQNRRALVAQNLDYFPLGIDPIDKAMYGGLSYGELEVPVAYSGIGKSFYCNQRGFICVRMRRRALHFVLEGGRAKCEDRYEARFGETLYRAVRRGDFNSRAMELMRQEYAIYRQSLVIRGFADKTKQWRITVDDIMAELETLRQDKGWVPDMVIVDYGDLVWAPGSDERERQKSAFRALKALAERTAYRGHRGYAVCAPSQAVRPSAGADDREHVLRPRDVADCYEKVRVADAIITLNRTTWEKTNNRLRASLGKYRDAEDGVVARVVTDYDHGAFSVLGIPEPPPLAPPPDAT